MSPLDEEPGPAEAPQARAPRAAEPDRPREAPSTTGTARHPRRKLWLVGLFALLGLAAIAGAIDWWLGTRGWISTDDAFIAVHMVQVSPQVAGRVQSVQVNDNEEVHAGQPLVELDPADFRARLDQALADQQGAAGRVAQAKAQLGVARANLDAARAQVTAAEATSTIAATNLGRARELARVHSLALSQQQLDNAIASARGAAANLAAARQKATAAAAQLALDKTNIETAAAGLRSAAAQVEEARLSLSYTEIRAATSGHIAMLNVAPGNFVQVGQALMALVPNRVWVTANYKETEIGAMRVGDPADIYVDAYPGHLFHGHVQSIQAGSGAAFSLLPPENATGNYVKVVQRVPVKIVFDGNPGARWLLGPGMSVEPYVKIR